MPREDPAQPINRLLCALDPAELKAVIPDLEWFPLIVPTVLYDVGEAIEHVYFPEHGVVSMVTVMRDGAAVEAATVGYEGMVGLPVCFGEVTAKERWIVQVANGSWRMKRQPFLAHLETMPGLRQEVDRFAGRLLHLVSQSSACNALHPVGERCARWLLMTHDRMGGQDFRLTQEFLAQMLGVRRPTVTVVAGGLQAAGLIRYRRGHMEVLDREGLEEASCECYFSIRERFEGR